MENNTLLASLVEEALAKGLPMPLNWCVYEDLSDSYSYDDDDESDWDDYSDDYPDYEESEQAEDDPEDKEVRDDCDSQTTEDCHGGNEATRSIEDSPSVAENGQEDRDSDQTENNGEDGNGEGEDGQPGETNHSYENGQNSGEDGSDSGEGEEGTSPDSDGGQGGSDDGKTSTGEHADEGNGNGSTNTELVSALLTALQQKKERADARAERERAFHEDPEMTNWIEAEKKITDTIVQICERDCGRIKNAPTSWDTRAMSRDVAIGRWDRILRDKKWSHRTKNLVIFWDQSGSCDRYISAVRNALKTVAELGYRCTLFDASNGINATYSVVWYKTKSNQTTEDRYQNGPRLKEVAKDIGAKTDSNIICPSIADFIKICEKADVVMVLQDYDCVEPLFKAASKVSRRKCPHFIDLETRYDEPYEHNWNPGMRRGQKYAVPERWYRIWDVRGEDEY